MYDNRVDFNELVGKTILGVDQNGTDEIIFTCTDGSRYQMYHSQDCCESVEIDDINGDLNDLIGEKILVAEVRTSDEHPGDADPELIEYQDSFTWTFYTIRTMKTTIDIRWYGESNGYYSEEVDFEKIA